MGCVRHVPQEKVLAKLGLRGRELAPKLEFSFTCFHLRSPCYAPVGYFSSFPFQHRPEEISALQLMLIYPS